MSLDQRAPGTILILILVASAFIFTACNKKESEPVAEIKTETAPQIAPEDLALNREAADAWWLSGGQILASCLQHARSLQHQVSDFLDNPDQQKLQQAQQTWQLTANAYRAFYGHHYLALSEPRAFQFLAEVDFRIGAWPVQPGSLDSFGSYLYSGLVHDIGNPLTMENLLNLHGQVDSENATLGIFSIEYMLFGENGTRTTSDYLSQNKVTAEYKERGFSDTAELPNNRRRMLLTLQTGKLVEDLQVLVISWTPAAESSQITFWTALADARKHAALKAAFERGLAQLMVSSVEQQNASDLLIAMQALKPLPGLIQHENAQALNKEFAALEASLNKPVAAESKTDWQQIVGHLTAASKLFSPLPEAEDIQETMPEPENELEPLEAEEDTGNSSAN